MTKKRSLLKQRSGFLKTLLLVSVAIFILSGFQIASYKQPLQAAEGPVLDSAITNLVDQLDILRKNMPRLPSTSLDDYLKAGAGAYEEVGSALTKSQQGLKTLGELNKKIDNLYKSADYATKLKIDRLLNAEFKEILGEYRAIRNITRDLMKHSKLFTTSSQYADFLKNLDDLSPKDVVKIRNKIFNELEVSLVQIDRADKLRKAFEGQLDNQRVSTVEDILHDIKTFSDGKIKLSAAKRKAMLEALNKRLDDLGEDILGSLSPKGPQQIEDLIERSQKALVKIPPGNLRIKELANEIAELESILSRLDDIPNHARLDILNRRTELAKHLDAIKNNINRLKKLGVAKKALLEAVETRARNIQRNLDDLAEGAIDLAAKGGRVGGTVTNRAGDIFEILGEGVDDLGRKVLKVKQIAECADDVVRQGSKIGRICKRLKGPIILLPVSVWLGWSFSEKGAEDLPDFGGFIEIPPSR